MPLIKQVLSIGFLIRSSFGTTTTLVYSQVRGNHLSLTNINFYMFSMPQTNQSEQMLRRLVVRHRLSFFSRKQHFQYSNGYYKLPAVENEPMKGYEPHSVERAELRKAIQEMQSKVHEVPCIINGQKIFTGKFGEQEVCADHSRKLCRYHLADSDAISSAIEGALKGKEKWDRMEFHDRAAIFLKAASLLSGPYRYKVLAATMLGQGKNIWQAEIEAAAELADFWRFNCTFAEQIYHDQPPKNAVGQWNRIEYRPLEGFVAAISPFNFTAIGGNLCSAPALMGNVVLWKPSASAIYSNYLIYEILREAGLPDGVIQFVPSNPKPFANQVLSHPDLAGVHFTGSTEVFKEIWKQVAHNIDTYKSYPRLVGETGGKNLHFIHESAHLENAVHSTVRAAFEYQGQKCSACSRLLVPDSIWPQFKNMLISEVQKIQVSSTTDELSTFMGPVINRRAFEKIKGYIEHVKQSSDAEVLIGGKCDDSRGYFVEPTVILTENPQFKTLKEEIFGPVLTIMVYPVAEYKKYLKEAADASSYGLTGAIFARDRHIIAEASDLMRYAAGNLYINDKSTGAVVGQQPFGGGRLSGTNDKAGSPLNLLRWTSPRTIKEVFTPLSHWSYPSNLRD